MEIFENRNASYVDSIRKRKEIKKTFDLSLARFVSKHKKTSLWFSKYGKTADFLSPKSRCYFTQDKLNQLRRGVDATAYRNGFDSLVLQSPRRVNVSRPLVRYDQYLNLKERYSDFSNYLQDFIRGQVQGVSMVKMWNISLVTSIIFGMFLMTMIYRYMGQGVAAKMKSSQKIAQESASNSNAPEVLGDSTDNAEEKENEVRNAQEYTARLLQEAKDKEQTEYEASILAMVKGHPIESMVHYIAQKDKTVAAFLIGIAKQESDWGNHAPVLNGQDCYNYWGYRGLRARMGTGGHTCFNDPQDAVDTVAKRIEFLVLNEKADTPNKMVKIWKCGYDCSWDKKENVARWVNVVDMYMKKFDKADE
jgi:hypothetical protein